MPRQSLVQDKTQQATNKVRTFIKPRQRPRSRVPSLYQASERCITFPVVLNGLPCRGPNCSHLASLPTLSASHDLTHTTRSYLMRSTHHLSFTKTDYKFYSLTSRKVPRSYFAFSATTWMEVALLSFLCCMWSCLEFKIEQVGSSILR